MRRLAGARFLAVIGTSGCGKSSLVRAGLIPSLKRGYLSEAGTGWKVAVMRPGSDPFGALARELDDRLGPRDDRLGTLLRSSLGCVECVRPDLGEKDSLLLVVDQFEEIFRFRQETQHAGADDQADAFVKLLLACTEQDEVPIYVVLTMRSDYLGDCAVFRELPEALNDAQYLVPVLTRRQLREVIEEPVHGGMAPELAQRLLNDVGHGLEQELDQLPVLEHALMCTWRESKSQRSNRLELGHYEKAGRMSGALNKHAEQLYRELSERDPPVAKKLFQRLTEKESAGRDIRRPTSFRELREVTGVSEEQLQRVIVHFQEFLSSPDTKRFKEFSSLKRGAPISDQFDDLMIDITHEALIREWKDLREWVVEETHSGDVYRRLAYDASSQAGKWEDPDLTEALRLREASGWSPTWASRYTPRMADFPLKELALRIRSGSFSLHEPGAYAYPQAGKFLHESEQRRFWIKARNIVLVFLLLAIPAAVFWYQGEQARQEAEIDLVRGEAQAKATQADLLLARATTAAASEKERLENEAARLREESRTLAASTQDYETLSQRREAELAEARSSRDAFALRLGEAEEKASEVQQQLSSAEQEKTRLLEDKTGLAGKLGALETEKTDLATRLEATESERTDLAARLAVAENELAQIVLKPGTVRVNAKDGLEYVWIPPGEFQMGCVPGDDDCYDTEEPRHAVNISQGFWLGRTEVTVKAYRDFLEETTGEKKSGQDDHPVTEVDWDDARGYCEWAGGRLPTEAEWEYAARAGKEGLKYPWGNRISRDRANYDGTGGRDTFRRTTPVGRFPPNEWGLHDMVGNVYEWCSDSYEADYYSSLAKGEPAKDPKGPPTGSERVLRGGAWGVNPVYLRSSLRLGYQPEFRFDFIGFRCAREVSP